MAAHKWASEIHAFADGIQIQSARAGNFNWLDDDRPDFSDPEMRFRVKPAEPERVYPVTQLDCHEIERFLESKQKLGTTYSEDLESLVNYALRHAIDSGQVVTREEFDKLIVAHADAEESLIHTQTKLEAANSGHAARELKIAEAVMFKTIEWTNEAIRRNGQLRTSSTDLANIIAGVKP